MDYIPLEKPIADLEVKISELKRLAASQAVNLDGEIADLESKAAQMRNELFSRLTPYEIAQISRHPKRPTSLDIISYICDDFIEVHGDRNFLDDKAIVTVLGKIAGISCVIIGNQKGRGTKDNITRNFGMSRPEGYRKALRLMSMAERFQLPIVTLVDTPGAYPGVGAEERGQSEAIAKNIMVMSQLRVPIVTVVTGEGGSGGALALAVANRVYMMAYSIYSVISPEGCASILMKDASKASQSAKALKLTAEDAKGLKIIDGILPEPIGGAHRSLVETSETIKAQLLSDIEELRGWTPEKLVEHRREKFTKMGQVVEKKPEKEG